VVAAAVRQAVAAVTAAAIAVVATVVAEHRLAADRIRP